METVYLQMAASRELAEEHLRAQDEHDARPKAGRSAPARTSYEEAPRQAGPKCAGVSPKNGPWRIESWRGAGW